MNINKNSTLLTFASLLIFLVSCADKTNIKEVEEGKYLEPKFDKNGLIPVITSDFVTGDILMHGYMNDEALIKTIETTEAHYWSR